MADAHEIWSAAQLAPGEGIEDGVARIEALLALPAPAGEPEMPKPFGYVSDGFPDGLHFSHKPWDGLHLLVNSTGPVFPTLSFKPTEAPGQSMRGGWRWRLRRSLSQQRGTP